MELSDDVKRQRANFVKQQGVQAVVRRRRLSPEAVEKILAAVDHLKAVMSTCEQSEAFRFATRGLRALEKELRK